MKPQNILGIQFGHNSGVVLMQDNKVKAAYLEERFTRIKNHTGFPKQAYKNLLNDFLDGNPENIDIVVFPTDSNLEYDYFIESSRFTEGFYEDYYYKTEKNFIPPDFVKDQENFSRKYCRKCDEHARKVNNNPGLFKKAIKFYSQNLKLNSKKFFFINHHLAHAYSCCFNLDKKKKTLIFTLDASGDHICATVNVFSPKGLINISRTVRYPSLAMFYHEVTAFLGLKPSEHEYKVMGLAPYAKKEQVKRLYENKFKDLFWVDEGLEFHSRFPAELTRYHLLETCVYERFDSIAGAAQMLIEEKVTEYISKWMDKLKIYDIAVSGGIFMNVKLNQRISEIDKLKSIFVMPSAGDESLPYGCCFYGFKKLFPKKHPEPLEDLYLGKKFSEEEIKEFLEKVNKKKYLVRCSNKIEARIANLLCQNEIVARFNGREEWGARALGNRSILANPADYDTVRKINEKIKNRDFWMPFTPSILEEDSSRYLINPKKISAFYMVIAFNSTTKAKEDLLAALHPHDFTLRPQIVRRKWNQSYYQILKEFKKRTGIGGVLNTSYNTHGEPIVHSLTDAFRTFENSGLKYLARGNLLIKKISRAF